MGKKAIFITVRSGSTRLQDKCFLKIGFKHTIEYVIQQAKKSLKADIIVLCTTNEKSDDKLCKIAEANGISFFRGSTNDKLERWNSAAKQFNVDFFVTADGDDLLCSHELMDLAFDQYQLNNPDFIKSDDVICGVFTYGIKSSALSRVCKAKKSKNTEMMWIYFADPETCDIENLQSIPHTFLKDNCDIRMTLDYEDDLIFFTNVISNISKEVDIKDAIAYIRDNPEVAKINFYLQDAWKNNQEKNTLQPL